MIKIISTATVRAPAEHHLDQRVELTPMDLPVLLMAHIQKGLLFHKPENMTTDLLIRRLKTSLSHTLHFFPPLAGRLSRTDSEDGATASFFIDCNNVGARFVRSSADSVSVSDILGHPYVPPVVHSLFPLNGVRNHEGVTQPLLAVQLTELVDGVFIGCAINHVVADGSSFWHFLNSWSEISRGHDTVITKPPSLRRWFPSGDDQCPICIPLDQLQGGHVQPCCDYELPDLTERIFRFKKECVTNLKVRANMKIGMDGRISSLQALLAHVWRSVIRGSHMESDDEEVKLIMMVGARPRVQQLSEQYFGNAIQVAVITMKACELIRHGIGRVSWEMNKAVGSYTQENIETRLNHWVKNPMLETVMNNEAALRKPFLTVSSSPRFDVYGNDFGWGRPVAVRSGPENKRDDRVTLFPGVETGSIEVHIRLLPQTLYAMERDVEYMDWVAND